MDRTRIFSSYYLLGLRESTFLPGPVWHVRFGETSAAVVAPAVALGVPLVEAVAYVRSWLLLLLLLHHHVRLLLRRKDDVALLRHADGVRAGQCRPTHDSWGIA